VPNTNTLLQLRKEITSLENKLLENNLLIQISELNNDHLGGRVTRIAWKGYNISHKTEFASVEQYRELLMNEQYSFILFDGSIFQIVYLVKNHEIIGHSLGYYPCPIPLMPAEFSVYQETGLTLEDTLAEKLEAVAVGLFDIFRQPGKQNLDDLKIRLRSPLRFDFDKDSNRLDHPGSHLHFYHQECRVPVFAPLSIGHFVNFIFKHFYPELWGELEFLRTWPCTIYPSTIMSEHRSHLHIDCIEHRVV